MKAIMKLPEIKRMLTEKVIRLRTCVFYCLSQRSSFFTRGNSMSTSLMYVWTLLSDHLVWCLIKEFKDWKGFLTIWTWFPSLILALKPNMLSPQLSAPHPTHGDLSAREGRDVSKRGFCHVLSFPRLLYGLPPWAFSMGQSCPRDFYMNSCMMCGAYFEGKIPKFPLSFNKVL